MKSDDGDIDEDQIRWGPNQIWPMSDDIEWKTLIASTVTNIFTKYTINNLTDYKKIIYEL